MGSALGTTAGTKSESIGNLASVSPAIQTTNTYIQETTQLWIQSPKFVLKVTNLSFDLFRLISNRWIGL
jgi:hypothetical protein